MPDTISLSTVLPAYNEVENIAQTTRECLEYLQGRVDDFEVIVVNDGSSDGTPDVINDEFSLEPRVRLVNHETNMGYGSALRSGFDAAEKEYIFFMDSDGQFNIVDIDRLLPFISYFDVVIGHRENRSDPLVRTINASLYMGFIRLLFGLKVRDLDCAFKIFPRALYHSVRPIKSSGALFSAELLIKLKRTGASFKEVGVRHFPRREGEQTGANLKVILRMFKEVWKLRNEIKD